MRDAKTDYTFMTIGTSDLSTCSGGSKADDGEKAPVLKFHEKFLGPHVGRGYESYMAKQRESNLGH